MKKIILVAFSFSLLLISETMLAQITGNDTRPVRKDTVLNSTRPVLGVNQSWKSDTIPNRTEMQMQRDEYHRERMRLERERDKLDRQLDSLDRKYSVFANEHRKANLSKKVDSTAKVIGDKTVRAGASVAASVKDRSLKEVKGPHGETVYVDKFDRRYYINKEGKRVYLNKPKSK
ncbi:MAG: hypothetical protein ACKOW2_01980 [Sphingobacteriaceae bacterium]